MSRRAFHVQRPLVCAALFFGAGIAIGILWQRPLSLLPWAGLLLSALTAWFLHRMGRHLLWAASCFLLCVGMLLAIPAAHPVPPPRGEYTVHARAEGMPERRVPDGRAKVILRDVRLQDASGSAYRLSGAYLTYYPDREDALPQDGQQVQLRSRLYWPSPQQNPYGFNFRRYLLQQDIQVGLSGAKELVMTPADQEGPASPWLRLRLWIVERLDLLLYQHAPLAKALLIGQRAALPEEVSADFRQTGIAHVLSVSGLHVGILAMVLLALFKRLRMSAPLQFALLCLFLLAYCRLLDFAAPVLRASVLALFLSFGRLVHRRSDPLTSLAAAFMLILAFRPMDLFQVGFQLSFLAVLGILTLGDRLQAAYLRWREGHAPRWRHLDKAAYAMGTTLSATLFTAPLVMRVFHYVSPVGLLFSPLVCVVIGLVMSYALALLPLSLVSLAAARFLAAPLRLVIALLLQLTEWTASLSWASLRTAAPPLLLILALLLGLLLMTRYSRLKLRWRVLAALALLLPAVGLTALGQDGALRYTQLSMGNADAAVIEDGRRTYVIDTGQYGGDLSSYLLSRGRQVDKLYITHLHYDHIGGLEYLLNDGVPIRQILLPEGAEKAKVDGRCLGLLQLAREQGIPVDTLAAGDALEEGRVQMQVCWPVSGQLREGGDPNRGSLAMLWDLDGVRLLTTGDLTRQHEQQAAVSAQVLKVAHHGSKGSNAQAFLEMVQPEHALLSASELQLPRMGDLLERLAAMGCESHITATGGALTLRCSDGRLKIDSYLKGGKP